MPTGSRTLLISYDYAQHETHGPPFSVTIDEMTGLFKDSFEIELLVEEEVIRSHQGMAARGVTKLTEFAVMLTRQ